MSAVRLSSMVITRFIKTAAPLCLRNKIVYIWDIYLTALRRWLKHVEYTLTQQPYVVIAALNVKKPEVTANNFSTFTLAFLSENKSILIISEFFVRISIVDY